MIQWSLKNFLCVPLVKGFLSLCLGTGNVYAFKSEFSLTESQLHITWESGWAILNTQEVHEVAKQTEGLACWMTSMLNIDLTPGCHVGISISAEEAARQGSVLKARGVVCRGASEGMVRYLRNPDHTQGE